MSRLAEPMTGDGCRAERLTEAHRELLREACAEDPDLWQIYYVSYAPEQFDAMIHLDNTTALTPLDRSAGWDEGEPPQTWPSGM